MNKTLLLVARITSLISGILWCLTIVFIPVGVLNIMASKKFDLAERGDPTVTRDNVRNWSIYLLFTDMLSGILGLIAALGDENVVDVSSSYTHTGTSVEERLNNLSRLYDSGAISRDEYDQRRTKILDDI